MLIGLCGMPKSGKTAVADILVEKHGFILLDTKQVLRDMASCLTGLPSGLFVTQEDKEKLYNGIPRRTIMGTLGNVAEGLWGDSFMLNRALESVERGKYPNRRIVVDSLRKDQPIGFPGLVYEVIADRAVDTGNAFDRYDKSRINGIICNLGTLKELEESVARVFSL